MPVCTDYSLKRKMFSSSYFLFCPWTLIFAPNLGVGMALKSFKSLLVAVFSLIILLFSNMSKGAPQGAPRGEAAHEGSGHFDAGYTILHHVGDGYEFHFFNIGGHKVAIPLPVLLYSPQRGWSFFSSSHIMEGETFNGYKLDDTYIVPVGEDGHVDPSVKVYDLSLSRNVVQMLLAAIVLVWLMLSVAGKYKKNGFKSAPSGAQGFVEPVIVFLRDQVAVPNLGTNALRYMPFLLTIFFFILVNNLFGLIPGSANVTGNIAVTMVLALITFVVILFSSNRHYWGHIFWPPNVPFGIKLILIPVEIISNLFVKPAALMIRLFANMVAGHIVIVTFVSLIFIFAELSQFIGWGFSPVSIAFVVFITMIELLIAFVQAFIFTMLSAVFISQASEGDHEHGGHDDPVII
jgi:F-type H+-transporting ATPase subunit a